MAAPQRSGFFGTNNLRDDRFLGLTTYIPGQIFRGDPIPDSNFGLKSLDDIRFLGRINGIPRQIFGDDPFLGQ